MIKIIRQKLVVSFNKNKSLLIKSLKLYADKKIKVHQALISASQIKVLLAQKTKEAFRAVLTKQYKIINALKLDSQAVKNNDCTHTRYLSTANKIAHVLKRDDLQTLYDIAVKKNSKAVKNSKAKTKV